MPSTTLPIPLCLLTFSSTIPHRAVTAERSASILIPLRRTDADGHFIWPGFGDNMRVLLWILARCEGKVDARETAIGYVPYAKDINIEGLDITEDTVNELLSVDNEAWLADVENIKEFYDMIGGTVPCELREELSALKARLSK